MHVRLRPRFSPLTLVLGLLASLTVASVANPAPASAVGAGFAALAAPKRVLDTRPGQPTADGQFAGEGIRPPTSELALTVGGRVGLSPTAASVALTVTATGSSSGGHVTVYPCGLARPGTSSLNFAAGATVANTVITKLGDDGAVCVYTASATHLIVDVAGSFDSESFLALEAPERLVDTRPTGVTIDAEYVDDERVSTSVYPVRIAGRGSVSASARRVAINLTATNALGGGYVRLFACAPTPPPTSNVNYVAGVTRANVVLTALDANGDVCVQASTPVHVILDVIGEFPATTFTPLPIAERFADTRPGQRTVDGAFAGDGAQSTGSTLQLRVRSRGAVPTGATAVVLNVTATGPSANGYLTAHPQGSALPKSSNVNYAKGATVAGLVIAAIGPSGDVCIFTSSPTNLVVDVAGWMTGPAPSSASAPCPTRTSVENADTLRTSLVRRPALHRAVGTDQIAVYVCRIPANSNVYPAGTRHNLNSAQIAAWLQSNVAPYFATASGGKYSATFTGRGEFMLGVNDGPGECANGAADRTSAPFAAGFGFDTVGTFGGGGFAGPGGVSFDPADDQSPLVPTDGRGGWISGSNVSTWPAPGVAIHEVGHTLHWPHSFIGPGWEYDNPVDVMSGGQAWCDNPGGGGGQYTCGATHTLVFNRFAAGWLTNGAMASHRSGTVNYLLRAPTAGGLQGLVLPDPAQPLSLLTLEARPAIGLDKDFTREGVAVHVVDQVTRTSDFFSGFSLDRIQKQAIGGPDSYDHVLTVGSTTVVHGARITVLAKIGNDFMVQVSGSYRMPTASFFTRAVGIGPVRGPSCATFTLAEARAAGCIR